MNDISLQHIFASLTILISLVVGVFTIRLATRGRATANHALTLETLKAIQQEHVMTLREEIADMQRQLKIHQDHVDQCEAELDRLRALLGLQGNI